VPETFFIGRDGRVVHKQIGPLTLGKIMDIIDPLLAEAAGGLDAADDVEATT
jgi:hypothetical protein